MIMEKYLQLVMHNNFVRLVLIWIALDTVLGCLRAIRERRFNSTVGIDGGIRKVAMIVCVLVLMLIDIIMRVNVISWLPDNFTIVGIDKLGIGEFFSILFILYESVSILKNMMLCGVPAPSWLKNYIEKFLENMTTELPKKEDE